MMDKAWAMLNRRTAVGLMSGGAAIAGATGASAAAKAVATAAAPPLDVKLDIDGYKPTDGFFDKVYIDIDEVRTDYVRHRFIHGGFKGTGTRFTIHLPEAQYYKGRFVQPLEGGTGGNEYSYGAPQEGAMMLGGLDMAVRLGCYLVQSNQGHVGTEKCPKGGDDVSIYGYRASAEVGRFARDLATQVYGTRPKKGYVFGGSGGGKRCISCIEGGPDIWDGGLPFMAGGQLDPKGGNSPVIATQIIFYTALLNVQRMLRTELKGVVDSVEPGGSGNPFETLNVDQREALADLYRCGFPRGAEFLLDPDNYTGQIFEWAWSADNIFKLDPDYFTDFWSKPGYGGHDTPHIFVDDIVDTTATVKRVVTAGDLAAAVAAGGPEARSSSVSMIRRMAKDTAVGVILEETPKGYMVGAGMAIATGEAAGRTLYCTSQAGDTYLGNALDVAGNVKFAGVKPGDKIRITNKPFLAYCHWYRHHVVGASIDFANEMVDGRPLFPQREKQMPATIFTGGWNTAKIQGKMLWYQHTHDTAVWAAPPFEYVSDARRIMGEKLTRERVKLRFTEHAHHIPAAYIPANGAPVPTTRLISYMSHIEQGLQDLIDWVEGGVEPAETHAEYREGKVVLPPTAAGRGGIQAVVNASANGGPRADVKVGQAVTLGVSAEVPPGMGTVVAVEWDFDGLGSYPFKQPEVDGKAKAVKLSTTHAFDKPGTYFPAVRVISHRQGVMDPKAARRIENLGRVRVVVT
ncbi:MAG: hypothetical protein JWP35_3051 [Caulobacter sp.]|nr:hypothetical protein [Caulobacter sp.]